jgi:hypothetical protein
MCMRHCPAVCARLRRPGLYIPEKVLSANALMVRLPDPMPFRHINDFLVRTGLRSGVSELSCHVLRQ